MYLRGSSLASDSFGHPYPGVYHGIWKFNTNQSKSTRKNRGLTPGTCLKPHCGPTNLHLTCHLGLEAGWEKGSTLQESLGSKGSFQIIPRPPFVSSVKTLWGNEGNVLGLQNQTMSNNHLAVNTNVAHDSPTCS